MSSIELVTNVELKKLVDRVIKIGDRWVGPGHPVFIVAELSANHNQKFERAMELVNAAKLAGADAVKLQTYTPETLTMRSEAEYFRVGEGTPWAGRRLYDLYSEAYMPWDWQPKLNAIAREIGIQLFSTASDQSAVTFLEEMNVPAYKVASFEIVDIPLIEKIARTHKPLVISTGMATIGEIDEAVNAARKAGAAQIALLKCTSAYPAHPEQMNLRTIPAMAETFGVPVGLSDHTMDLIVPVTAVAVGACIIEKHLTISRSEPGPDSSFSLEPREFGDMVSAIRACEKALGEKRYGVLEQERGNYAFRRSLFVVEDIKVGQLFTPSNLRSIRSSHGLHTRYLDQIIGRHATQDIRGGTPLSWDMVAAART